MTVTVLTPLNLNERVYDELRTRVLTRQEPSGAKLSLHALADELGVSRSPVHHALTRLVSEGLLSVQPRRGYYVTPVTARAVAEGYDVRLALELIAAERAIEHLDESRLVHFAELLEATDAAISHEEWDAANAGVPRAPDRPRRERAAVALLPRAVGEPDDAGHPWRPSGGAREPRHRASQDRRDAPGPATSTPRNAQFASTSRPAVASRSTRSSEQGASFDRGGTVGSPASPLLLAVHPPTELGLSPGRARLRPR